jgi:leucyl aminopeptidase
MKFEIAKNPISKVSADVAILFVTQNKKGFEISKNIADLPPLLQRQIEDQLILEEFEGKKGEISFVFTGTAILAPRIAVIGLGSKKEISQSDIREAAARLTKKLPKSINSIVTSFADVSIDFETQAQMIIEGIELGSYSFGQYKKKEKQEKTLELVTFCGGEKASKIKIERGANLGHAYFLATKMARDLVNEQSAVATPTLLAQVATEIANQNEQISVTIFDKKELEEMGAHAFLGIARGADTPPKFIVLEYTPKTIRSKKTVAIVGKGITFDTGGINVKPDGYMTTMKMDMAGGAAVLGVFSALGIVKPSFQVLGIIAATPNVISGKSILPGDVVRAMNGKSIEINHTDAEGRVTLADSLSYAVKQHATEIVDLATLTGACMVALGNEIAGAMGNDQALLQNLKIAGDTAGEKIWELPLPDEYKDLNKSDVADLSNMPSSRYGGAIAAGLFLQEFVDTVPWVHLDIAGPAFAEKDHIFGQKGGTGFGVRLLLQYLRTSKS